MRQVDFLNKWIIGLRMLEWLLPRTFSDRAGLHLRLAFDGAYTSEASLDGLGMHVSLFNIMRWTFDTRLPMSPI